MQPAWHRLVQQDKQPESQVLYHNPAFHGYLGPTDALHRQACHLHELEHREQRRPVARSRQHHLSQSDRLPPEVLYQKRHER
jgi:hypothetical protein